MEVTIDIGYEQLLAAIKKLPAAKINQLKYALDESFINEKATEELSDFQSYLLSAPVMAAKQFEKYKSERKYFSQSAARYFS